MAAELLDGPAATLGLSAQDEIGIHDVAAPHALEERQVARRVGVEVALDEVEAALPAEALRVEDLPLPEAGRADVVAGDHAVGTLRARDPNADGSQRVEFGAPDAVLRYVVEKGSITVDGVSLTVAEVLDDGFAVAVIPHTLAVTTLGAKAPGDRVNREVDVVAKYVERLLANEG